MQNLLTKIEQYVTLSSTSKSILLNNFKKENFNKDSLIIHRNKICDKLYFVEKGLVRSFYYNNGKDRTSWFYNENQLFTSWYSFYTDSHSFEDMETVENTTVYSITKNTYNKLVKTNEDLATFSRLFAQEQYAKTNLLIKHFIDISAKEKYELVQYEMPYLEERVKLQHIASLIGISQETLSRIRSRKRF